MNSGSPLDRSTIFLSGFALKRLTEQTMNSQATTQIGDEKAIRAIHQRMIDAWNTGDGAAFAAPFTEDANFVAFEGTHLKGRQEITSFHQRIFDTVVKGSRLEGGEVKFVHFLGPALAVMHSVRQRNAAGADQTVTESRFNATYSCP
jgi:uncharacterized protein (TIGR02246 family)